MKSQTICAIAGIVILESVAMLTHTDGRYLGIALVAVAGLGGYSLANLLRRKP
jgi:hypothetical protein